MLGGLASSRLDKIMVRDEKLAVAVSAQNDRLFNASASSASAAYVKPGVDPKVVSKRLDEILADYIAKGPTADEVQRAVMSEVSGQIRGLEQVGGFGGKAVSLAEGQTYAHDSDFYKKTLASYASITPAAVRAAMQQWLRRPALTIILSPGRARGVHRSEGGRHRPSPATRAKARSRATARFRRSGSSAALQFPAITHTQLSNGIPVEYAQRTTIPVTQIALSFDAGAAADSPQARGLADMTMSLLDEGTSKLSSQEVAETEERLGADVSTQNGGDRSYVMLSALTPNLAPSLDLMSGRGEGCGVPARRHRSPARPGR